MTLGEDIGNQLIAIVEKVKEDLAYTYVTRAYVDEIISAGIVTRIVEELPETGDRGVVYLIPVEQTYQTDYNIYKEWTYVNGRWEDLGSTELNLEDYPTATYIEERLDAKLPKGDPSIPTKLSDLELDEDSKFVSLALVNSLPSVTNAHTNTIYIVPYTVPKTTYTTGRSVEIPATEYLGTILSIKNNGSAAVSLFRTDFNSEEESTADVTIAANSTEIYNLPTLANKLRLESSTTLNVEITWNRGTADTYLKYIKVNDNGTYKWESLSNPDNVTFQYLHDNYYMKSQVYTEDDVTDSIDSLIDYLDANTEEMGG